MEKKICFYEAFAEEADLLKEYLPAGIEAVFIPETIQESGHTQPPAEIISTRTQSIYPPKWSHLLKAIISRSTGFDHLLAYRKETSTQAHLGYLPLYCPRAVAEQAFLLTLALMRKLPQQIENFKTFKRDGLTGRELFSKTMAVYGVGNIGYEIVQIGRAFGLSIIGVDIEKKYQDVHYLEPRQAAQKADIILCAMNLTEQNVGYFDLEFFKHVKESAVFVNISRGELSPATVLSALLETERIAGVGLDVYAREKKLAGFLRGGQNTRDEEVEAVRRLMGCEKAILTPHNAFNTEESVVRKTEQTIEQLIFLLENNRFKWPV